MCECGMGYLCGLNAPASHLSFKLFVRIKFPVFFASAFYLHFDKNIYVFSAPFNTSLFHKTVQLWILGIFL
ncbi:unnamed protein product [Phytomonas sp. Hart1]|nr:unnamed protein product [Phytomonas sp. Hart1]|eukprot:CCW71974.1 unnamed protein product [Phytomonas sp. isolate Hart1]